MIKDRLMDEFMREFIREGGGGRKIGINADVNV